MTTLPGTILTWTAFWLKDDSLEDSDNLPEPDVIGLEIIEDLEAALEQFKLIIEDIGLEEVV